MSGPIDYDDLCKRLRDAEESQPNVGFGQTADALVALRKQLREAESELALADKALDAMHRIAQWANAYPLEVFPMPDFERANEVLARAGISMTAMSAANMRHVVEGVGKIAKAALLAGKKP